MVGRLLLFGILGLGANSARAGTINFEALMVCPDCAQFTLSWEDMQPAVVSVQLLDPLGNVRFYLGGPLTPQSTGSIIPNPLTISGLDDEEIELVLGSLLSVAFTTVSPPLAAKLELPTVNAPDSEAPEPSTWIQLGVGSALLVLGRLARKTSTKQCPQMIHPPLRF